MLRDDAGPTHTPAERLAGIPQTADVSALPPDDNQSLPSLAEAVAQEACVSSAALSEAHAVPVQDAFARLYGNPVPAQSSPEVSVASSASIPSDEGGALVGGSTRTHGDCAGQDNVTNPSSFTAPGSVAPLNSVAPDVGGILPPGPPSISAPSFIPNDEVTLSPGDPVQVGGAPADRATAANNSSTFLFNAPASDSTTSIGAGSATTHSTIATPGSSALATVSLETAPRTYEPYRPTILRPGALPSRIPQTSTAYRGGVPSTGVPNHYHAITSATTSVVQAGRVPSRRAPSLTGAFSGRVHARGFLRASNIGRSPSVNGLRGGEAATTSTPSVTAGTAQSASGTPAPGLALSGMTDYMDVDPDSVASTPATRPSIIIPQSMDAPPFGFGGGGDAVAGGSGQAHEHLAGEHRMPNATAPTPSAVPASGPSVTTVAPSAPSTAPVAPVPASGPSVTTVAPSAPPRAPVAPTTAAPRA
ncbi:hypothetical protein PYCCODRAFT_1470139, partial [Trametes coccinea BRFM310]